MKNRISKMKHRTVGFLEYEQKKCTKNINNPRNCGSTKKLTLVLMAEIFLQPHKHKGTYLRHIIIKLTSR